MRTRIGLDAQSFDGRRFFIGGALTNSPDNTIQHPYQSQHPTNRSVTSQVIPSKDKIQRERSAVDYRREQDEHRCADIVGNLEQEDLPDDFQWWEVGARPRGKAPAPGHQLRGQGDLVSTAFVWRRGRCERCASRRGKRAEEVGRRRVGSMQR